MKPYLTSDDTLDDPSTQCVTVVETGIDYVLFPFDYFLSFVFQIVFILKTFDCIHFRSTVVHETWCWVRLFLFVLFVYVLGCYEHVCQLGGAPTHTVLTRSGGEGPAFTYFCSLQFKK